MTAALDVYEVLAQFLAAQEAEPDNPSLLRVWAARFPDYEPDLIAAGYARRHLSPASPELAADRDDLDDAQMAQKGRQALAARRAALSPPLTSLLDDARRQNLAPAALAQASRIDVTMLARLERRLLDASTLPRALVDLLADALGRSSFEIAAFLRGRPRLPMQAHFRAKQAPVLREAAADPQTFAQALSASRELSVADRAFWRGELQNGERMGDE